MARTKLPPVHPGETLLKEYLLETEKDRLDRRLDREVVRRGAT